MKHEEQRIYHLSDPDMIEFIKKLIGFLENDLADFTAFDSTIDINFLNALKALAAEAAAIVSDNVVIDEMADYTLVLNHKMEECIELYQTLKYFIKKAFANVTIQNKLGMNDFAEDSKVHGKMVFFMRDLSENIGNYKTELMAVGCNEPNIDKVSVIYAELDAAHQKQESFKNDRIVITHDRIVKYNELWTETMKVVTPAKIIYKNDLARLKRYLPPTRNASKSNDITIAAASQMPAIKKDVFENTILNIENTGNVELSFFVADNIDSEQPDVSVTIAPEDNHITKAADISNGTYGMLIAKNNTNEEGKFIAEIVN